MKVTRDRLARAERDAGKPARSREAVDRSVREWSHMFLLFAMELEEDLAEGEELDPDTLEAQLLATYDATPPSPGWAEPDFNPAYPRAHLVVDPGRMHVVVAEWLRICGRPSKPLDWVEMLVEADRAGLLDNQEGSNGEQARTATPEADPGRDVPGDGQPPD